MCPHCGYELFEYQLRHAKKYKSSSKVKYNIKNKWWLLIVVYFLLSFVYTHFKDKEEGAYLKYEILKNDITDVPLKTQVALTIVLTDETTKINKETVSKLLANLYKRAKSRSGFKYHTHPTNVYIWAFTTKDKANAGMGQWVGMISDAANETNPDLKISDIQLNSLVLKPVDRFGLPETIRLEIWHKAINVEDRAQKEADLKYPMDKKGITRSYILKYTNYRDKLEVKYESELVREYVITNAILDSISFEASHKGWAYPSMHLFD